MARYPIKRYPGRKRSIDYYSKLIFQLIERKDQELEDIKARLGTVEQDEKEMLSNLAEKSQELDEVRDRLSEIEQEGKEQKKFNVKLAELQGKQERESKEMRSRLEEMDELRANITALEQENKKIRRREFGITVAATAATVLSLLVAALSLLTLRSQNETIREQSYLMESARRSAFGGELNQVLDKVDEELADKSKADELPPYQLSPYLEDRIMVLSRSLQPYRYLQEDDLIASPLSPERGKLLVYLVTSRFVKLSDGILENSDFSRADLAGKNLESDSLNLKNINLQDANLQDASLRSVRLRGARLQRAHLQQADLSFVDLQDATLEQANLEGAILEYAKFLGTNLADANLTNAHLMNADLLGVRKLTWQQLCAARSLHKTKLDVALEDSVKVHCPQKMVEPNLGQ